MLREQGSGVATYAGGLQQALALAGGGPPLVVRDRQGGSVGEVARSRPLVERWRRWIVTQADRPVRVRPTGDELVAFDIFRRAHRHFRRHGSLLRLRAPESPAGIVHWTYPVPIVLEGWTNIYTVHDAIPFTHAELTTVDPDRHRRLLRAIAQRAAVILTVSDDAARAIADADAVGAAPIVNGGLAVPAPEPAGALPAGLSEGGYLLVCGVVEPRKNVARLVAAWQASGTGLPLVVAGPDGWGAEALHPLLAQPGVIRFPLLPRGTLAAVQAGARALLFPSLAEGFGLPIIEAMACGTPVMTGAGGATGETAGGGALLVDPLDVAAMAAAIARLSVDQPLCDRLAEAGRTRARAFSPERFAERLAALHRSVIVNRGEPLYRAAEG